MQRFLKLSFLPFCIVLVALGAPAAAATDSAPAPAPAPAAQETDPVAETAVPTVETAISPASACWSDAETAPASALSVDTPIFLGDVCVGHCKFNADCDAYCGPGNGGCDLNPANPCYRQCICLL